METGSNIQAVRYSSASLQPDQSASYALSLKITPSGTTYSIYHTEQNKVLHLEQHTAEGNIQLKDLLINEELLNLRYGRVRVGIVHQRSALVPEEVFEPQAASEFLAFNHAPDAAENVRTDKVSSIGSMNVWAIDKELETLLSSQFKGVKFYHGSTALLEGLVNEHKARFAPQLFLCAHTNYFDLVYLNKGKLSFYNTFEFQNAEDMLYHTMFAIQQLKLDPANVPLHLLGNIDKHGPHKDLLAKYISKVELGTRPAALGFDTALDKLDTNKHYMTFALNLCE